MDDCIPNPHRQLKADDVFDASFDEEFPEIPRLGEPLLGSAILRHDATANVPGATSHRSLTMSSGAPSRSDSLASPTSPGPPLPPRRSLSEPPQVSPRQDVPEERDMPDESADGEEVYAVPNEVLEAAQRRNPKEIDLGYADLDAPVGDFGDADDWIAPPPPARKLRVRGTSVDLSPNSGMECLRSDKGATTTAESSPPQHPSATVPIPSHQKNVRDTPPAVASATTSQDYSSKSRSEAALPTRPKRPSMEESASKRKPARPPRRPPRSGTTSPASPSSPAMSPKTAKFIPSQTQQSLGNATSKSGKNLGSRRVKSFPSGIAPLVTLGARRGENTPPQ
mmetsp:Transcript_31815/g.95668  ORF Transcript_31815/g.95668 Transcript_31815/m.95668 type:complete len:338 (-) Transcript_31815:256-1269(-)